MKIGFSKDIHVTKKGIPLVLGGVNIPSDFGLESHSDGDCLILGKHFPPNDDKFKNYPSTNFLIYTKELLKKMDYKICNIDSFISCEKPKLATYIEKMKENIADLLEIDVSNVSVKAGTNEKMGYIGESKAIEAYCVVLLEEVK